MLSRLFNYKFHVLPFINPFIHSQINSLRDFNGTNVNKRKTPIIISLTSYKERFENLPITIFSLLKQKRKPDRIILWLSDELNLSTIPYEISQFIKNGLEIKFVKDIGPYTKNIYALKEYQNSIIVTADDDIYYPSDWLDKLYLSYMAYPDDIHCHRAHRVEIFNGEIMPYETWKKHVNEESACFDNFLTGVGGVLYPPKCFNSEALRKDIFKKYSPNADDIWFWVMAVINNKKIRIVKNHNKHLISVNMFEQISKNNLYKTNKNGGNDKQLASLMQFYGQNIYNRILAENK